MIYRYNVYVIYIVMCMRYKKIDIIRSSIENYM